MCVTLGRMYYVTS